MIVLNLILILLGMSQIIPCAYGDSEVDQFVISSINNWVTETFLDSFKKYTLPSESDVAEGSKLYNQMKSANFEENGKSGISLGLPVTKLKELLELFEKQDLISAAEKTNQDDILSTNFFKTILEQVLVRSNGDIVYGITGLFELAKNGQNDERKGTIFYSLRRFKLETTPTITYERTNIDSGTCSLWGQFCSTIFKIDGLDDGESQSLFSYMRSETMKQFVEQTGAYDSYIKKEATKYERFLPSSLEDALTKIRNNPDESLDKLFETDPFDVSKIDEMV